MNTEGAENARDWQAMMMVNAIAPYQLGKALLPRMADGGKMIAISSGMGSIGDNGGGWVPYRTSKAALNMAWSNLAMEAKPRGVACVAAQPRLGEDAHGRRRRRDHAGAKRQRHAPADRPADDRRHAAIPPPRRLGAALVGCQRALVPSIGARFPDRWKNQWPGQKACRGGWITSRLAMRGNKETKMPKLKTKSGVKKRFKLTATGKIKHGVAGKRHRLISHNAKYIRQNRGTEILADADTARVKAWAPYGLK